MIPVLDRPTALEGAIALDLDPALNGAVAKARAEASAVLTTEVARGTSSEAAERMFTCSLLAHLAADGALERQGVAIVEDIDPQDFSDIAFGALGHPRLAALPLPVAFAAVGSLLSLLGGVRSFSAWRPDAAARLVKVHACGEPTSSKSTRTLARRALETGAPQSSGGMLCCPVDAFGSPAAVLAWEAPDMQPIGGLARRAAMVLSAPLQHALTADGNLAQHRALVQAPERRLTRLALDIHDGALQDLALIAGELRRLEDELRPAVAGTPQAEPIRSNLDSIATLVEALDGDLRSVATSLEGPSMFQRPFADAIEAIVERFTARSPIQAAMEIEGDVDSITDSQRIALVRIVQEALANVREHSDAHRVRVSVVADHEAITASIADDGVGFNTSRVVGEAARAGRLGLLGMAERVRMLGGVCDIRSRPGNGTTISVRIVRYEPVPDRRSDLRTA